MQTAHKLVRLALVIALTVPLVSCAFFDQLGAMRTFKDANTFYQRGDYEQAIEEYMNVVETVEADPDSELSQAMSVAYFYVGNSYDSLYTPAFRGQAENDAYLDRAEEFYQKAADAVPNDDFKKLAMQYLVATYGPDKLNDPTSRAGLLMDMIQLEPDNPENYFALAQLFEQSGFAELAEDAMTSVLSFNSDDPTVYLQLAGYYDRAGNFEEMIAQLTERARIEPDNPEAFYTISTTYWNKAFRDFTITEDQKLEYIMSGIDAADDAINLNARYVDALVYKNILLRMQAGEMVCVDTDDTECINAQDGLIAEAEELEALAQQIQDEQRAQAAAAPSAGE